MEEHRPSGNVLDDRGKFEVVSSVDIGERVLGQEGSRELPGKLMEFSLTDR